MPMLSFKVSAEDAKTITAAAKALNVSRSRFLTDVALRAAADQDGGVRDVADVADELEVRQVLTKRVRSGSVQAAKLLLERLDRDVAVEEPVEDPADELDALDNVTPLRRNSA